MGTRSSDSIMISLVHLLGVAETKRRSKGLSLDQLEILYEEVLDELMQPGGDR